MSPATPVVVLASLACVLAALIAPWLWMSIALCVIAAVGLALALYDWMCPV